MSKILIVYGSTTGNTEWVAGQLEKQFKDAGHTVQTAKAGDIPVNGLCQGRDLVLFGCSTWGQDEIELQDDFVPLYESFENIGASDVKTAVFGCGDEDYTHFCGAVDAITDKLKNLGSTVIGDKLKINGDPGDSAETIKNWGKTILATI